MQGRLPTRSTLEEKRQLSAEAPVSLCSAHATGHWGATKEWGDMIMAPGPLYTETEYQEQMALAEWFDDRCADWLGVTSDEESLGEHLR
ncbi:hypothetical protein ACMFMG_006311 [Clarireedia jacksonii]